jgi:CspA family cold shock protein
MPLERKRPTIIANSKTMPLEDFMAQLNKGAEPEKTIVPESRKEMKTGTVKFYNQGKGYGFITPDRGGKDIFVPSSGLINQISMGDKVTYEEEMGQKGLNAVNVKKLAQ